MDKGNLEQDTKPFKNEWYLKMAAMQKLYNLRQKKIQLTRDYTMQDNLEDMEAEYNMHLGMIEEYNAYKLAKALIKYFIPGTNL